MEARATLEPPNYGYVDVELIENDEHDYESYEELCFQLTELDSGDIGTLFGYPSTQHGDCEFEAALMLLTGSEYNYSMDAAMQQIAKHCGGSTERAQQEIQDTMLLLAVDSDDDVGFAGGMRENCNFSFEKKICRPTISSARIVPCTQADRESNELVRFYGEHWQRTWNSPGT